MTTFPVSNNAHPTACSAREGEGALPRACFEGGRGRPVISGVLEGGEKGDGAGAGESEIGVVASCRRSQ